MPRGNSGAQLPAADAKTEASRILRHSGEKKLIVYLRASILLEPLIFEFERLAVLGNCANHIVGNSFCNSGLNFQRHFHIRIQEASKVLENLG